MKQSVVRNICTKNASIIFESHLSKRVNVNDTSIQYSLNRSLYYIGEVTATLLLRWLPSPEKGKRYIKIKFSSCMIYTESIIKDTSLWLKLQELKSHMKRTSLESAINCHRPSRNVEFFSWCCFTSCWQLGETNQRNL